jgi:hypothetical protein
MKNVSGSLALTVIGAAVVGLFMASCNTKEQALPDASTPVTGDHPSSLEPSAATSTVATPTSASVAQDPTTVALTTAAEVTTTLPPGPPVYDPSTLGNNLDLPSFIFTTTVDNTNGGQLSHTATTSGYIAAPLSAYEIATFGEGLGGTRSFSIDGRSFMEDISGDWYLDERSGAGAGDFIGHLVLRSQVTTGLISARFDAQGDHDGVTANHFVFDETDLASYASYSPEHPAPHVEGDLYVSVEGNHVLYAHSKETSPDRVYEVTEALSFIGLVPEITLPPDLVGMSQALDVGVALSEILPPDVQLSTLIRYHRGIGIDYYTYRSATLTSLDQFLTFYRNLAPTDGWSVAHIGHIRPHVEPVNCETALDCVILRKGNEQIVVSFAGVLRLEYDHDHVLSPS